MTAIVTKTIAQTPELSAKVDRNEVSLGETITLTIQATNLQINAKPDFTELSKNFDILDTNQGQQISIVNGKQSQTYTWQIELEPKQTGITEIPTLAIDKETTNPIQINVKKPNQSLMKNDEIFIEVNLEPNNAYVSQQLLLITKLYYRINIRGDFNMPEINNASVIRLGEEDISYTAKQNGKSYNVVERRFAITPEASGELVIPPIQFQGRKVTNNNPWSFSRNRGERVKVQSEPIILNVKPMPTSFSGSAWLPAKNLIITDSWQEDTPNLTVGEPGTRTIKIQAMGLNGNQLPEISIPESESYRIYPEKPTLTTQHDGKWLFATLEQKFALVPNQNGEISFPKLTIQWWNTETDQQKIATIPAITLTAEKNDEKFNNTTNTESVQNNEILKPLTPIEALSTTTQKKSSFWQIISLMSIGLWVITIFIWIIWQINNKTNNKTNEKTKDKTNQILSINKAKQVFHSSIKDNNPQTIKLTLLNWATLVLNKKINTLLDLCNYINDQKFKDTLTTLDEVIYNDTTLPEISLAELKKIDKLPLKTVTKKPNHQLFDDLYPVSINKKA